ncbi:hypothetical protein N1851_004173 [Merluccius polli]|uniref:Uncharacterized protein n=1 Tax=Merluccius polli TaxID=89951 RepID=A0AA47PAY3_MERPO|nr:hypothetical protein N1851_004173 [Merluccius polli]
MKVDSKKRITEYRQSVLITGGGSGKPPPSPLDERVAGIMGETLLSGIVPEDEGDTDAGERSRMDSAPDASSPPCTSGLSDPGSCAPSDPGTSAPSAPASASSAPASASSAPASASSAPASASSAPASASSAPASASSARSTPSGAIRGVPSARVLTDAVLQSQKEIIEAIGKLTAEVYCLTFVVQ